MDLVTWLRELSKHNSSAPNHPFPVRFDNAGYIYSTDKFVLAIASMDVASALIKEQCPLADTVYENVVTEAQRAQEVAKSIGVMDALSLKELVGEADWSDEAISKLESDDHPSVFISGCYFTKPVLARALEAWTEPLATVFLCDIFENEKAQALMLASKNILVLCMPYRPNEEGPLEDSTPIPEWMLVPV